MTTIKLYNTRTRKKEVFAPLDPGNVRMYVCGPTVYDRAHLGNARPVVVFDVLYRLLRHVYGADHVTYVRNFTDVDDKINARAKETGREISEITAETTQWFLDDMAELGALEPTHMPRATQYIPQMVAMIEDLIARGHAYEAEGHVLFSVESYAAYGRLSGRTVEDMIAGARVEVAPYKRNPMDFVLWKPSAPDLPGWESPWGRGRPGWHIECSAMAHELLGESFDIHGGGNDLMFPHHENEIAQSCCAHPEGEFAKVWLHNEMLQVEGKKMSKSLGNFFTVRDLLDQGVPGEVIRFVFLSTHYRKPMDWTEKKAKDAATTLKYWMGLTWELEPTANDAFQPEQQIVNALADDMNMHLALSFLRALHDKPQKLLDNARFLGFLSDREREMERKYRAEFPSGFGSGPSSELAALASELSLLWNNAKLSNDFSQVDAMKAELISAGVEVRMSKDGVELVPGPDFDPAKLEALK
ncbi:MAG: cysteine--tRNA ligase [Roseovarius sp.]|nr:cysteine--tRNA ligase [Roseovarius sp.]MBK43905.1 cysteine--tRNA ligase [Roseovarius sp.]